MTASDVTAAVRDFDQPRAEAAVRELLLAVGEDPDRHGLIDTPARVARAYREIFAGLYTDPDAVLNTTFDEQHDELVLVKQIPMYSTCEHHLVSFHGVAHVGYIPGLDGRVTGLSKIARLVDLYAKRPQVQERLTAQVADALMRKLDPRGVIVVIEAEHLCMAMRGVRKPGAVTTTSATADGSVTAASSITRTPPLWADARRRVTSRPSVVLPTPPGPTIVTSCLRSTIPANAARSSSRPSRPSPGNGTIGRCGAAADASKASRWACSSRSDGSSPTPDSAS